MSVLDSVLSAIRGKRQEQAKTVFGQYTELVDRLARDEKVDVDELGIVLDTLDKSDKDLRAEVKQKQRRFVLADLLADSRKLDALIPTLEAKHEAAKTELQKAIAKLQPALEKTWNELNTARLQTIQFTHVEPELLATVMDTELLERSKELTDKRHAVGMEIRDLQDEVATLRGRISHARSLVDKTHTENSRLPLAFGDEKQKVRDKWKSHQVKLAQEKYADEQRSAEPTFARFEKLKAEHQKLESEIRELNLLKLEP